MTLTPGVITSPNHPAHYPSNLEKTEQVVVESGKILRLEFAHFDVESKDDGTCPYDYVTIKNGDGNTLMEKTCGSSLPAAVNSTSNTNIVLIRSTTRIISHVSLLRWITIVLRILIM